MRNIIVCMKIVPKTEDVTFDPVKKVLDRANAESTINIADRNALENALRLKERVGGKVILVSMGPPMFESYLKLGIAMGADEAYLLSDRALAGADTFATAMALAGAIKKIGDYDVVLLGEESSDGGTGQVPAQVAELLGIPQILFVSDLDAVETTLTAKRSIKGGHEIVKAEFPVLVSTEIGSNQPRFPDFEKKKEIDKNFKIPVWTVKDLELSESETGLNGSYTIVESLVESETPGRKRKFIEGSPEQQTKELLKILDEI